MKRWLLAAALAAAALAQGAPSALAADLDDRYAPPRQGSAYDDPRYADLYGREPAPPPVQYGYRPYSHAPVPPAPIYRDYADRDTPPPNRRYAEPYPRDGYAPPHARAEPGCAPKDQIQHQLTRDGWHGFHEPRVIDRDTAFVKARRPSGRLFEIKLDRCSGDILAARPIEPRFYGPNTYGENRPDDRTGYTPGVRPDWRRTY